MGDKNLMFIIKRLDNSLSYMPELDKKLNSIKRKEIKNKEKDKQQQKDHKTYFKYIPCFTSISLNDGGTEMIINSIKKNKLLVEKITQAYKNSNQKGYEILIKPHETDYSNLVPKYIIKISLLRVGEHQIPSKYISRFEQMLTS